MLLKKTYTSGFGCFEVTIGWFGHRRVDYLHIDTKDNVRCYEIKVSKSDFHSKHGHNFLGNYNYYVMPEKLYEEIKDEIPNSIGCLVYKEGYSELVSVKKAKKLKISNLSEMKSYLIRSLHREYIKTINSDNKQFLQSLTRSRNYYENAYGKTRNELCKLYSAVYTVCGREVARKVKECVDI